jgi:large subunit ribosomal protein L24
MNKIKTGDEVIVITGRDKGRRGKVARVMDTGKLIVEGINLVKKHQKGNPNTGVTGGIIEKEMALQASNVMLYNSATGKGDRVGFRFVGEGEARRKVRFFKSNQEMVDA